MPAETTPEQERKVATRAYHGRVRSGCMTCRSRKVKCDEARPFCDNCVRLKRRCAYKPLTIQLAVNAQGSSSGSSVGSVESCELTRPLPVQGLQASHPDRCNQDPSYVKAQDASLAETLGLKAVPVCLAHDGQDPYLGPDSAIADVTERLQVALRRQNDTNADEDGSDYDPATLISRDIKLTTTMDLLRAREVPLQPAFPYFVDSMDCPAITPFDARNWKIIKCYLAELGTHSPVVASAIIALSTLYKALRYGLSFSRAVSFYHSSRNAYEKSIDSTEQNFDAIIAATFLLCLFDFVHQETVPLLASPSASLINILETGQENNSSHSEQSSRIICWLRILHGNALRAGGNGLISDSLTTLSPCCKSGQPVPRPLNDIDSDASIYDMLQHPIFEFYFQLQMISGQIAKLTHYHRSRITGVDQQEVVESMLHVRSRLVALWETRSAIQRQSPIDLRSNLAADIAEPIITLVGLCAAAYHAEFVEMDRVLGDPISKSTGSRHAMQEIRSIVDGDWNCYHEGKLNSGYLRPLFLYAIECMDRDDNRWAVERMESVKDCICRSDFFAEFGHRLSDAQLRKERRVTSKYFCIWYFGVPPPFM